MFLLIILAAGLKPRGFRFVNNVNWIADRSGIQFGRFGIAYTNPFEDPTLENISGEDGFSLEIAMQPVNYHRWKFRFICAFHGGNDSDQLVMGLWRSQLIIMNGDDYSYRRKTSRITADTHSPSLKTRLVTITSGRDGTRIFLDGKLESTKKDLRLKMPPGENARLIIGNSVYGRHPWRGVVYGLAFYNYPLSSHIAASHFNSWSKDRNFAFARHAKPSVLYLFNEKGGTRALDHSGSNHHLEIPSRMKLLERRILALPSRIFMSHVGFIIDIIINLVGFIPFGFLVCAILVRSGGTFQRHGVLITAGLCMSVSLSIEILQAWIPSRNSNILDLALNTLGGLSGAIIYRVLANLGIWLQDKKAKA